MPCIFLRATLELHLGSTHGSQVTSHIPIFYHKFQAFASPAKVAEVVSKVNEALAGPLPTTISKLRLYLPNPQTYIILFKPIKSSVAEAHGQMQALVAADYAPEEAASIPLKQQDELSALLDSMCNV